MKDFSKDRGANIVAGVFGIVVAIILYKNGYLDFLWRDREVEGYESGTLASVLVASLIDIVAFIGAVILTGSGFLIKSAKSGIEKARDKIEQQAVVPDGGGEQPAPNIVEIGKAAEYLLKSNEYLLEEVEEIRSTQDVFKQILRVKLTDEEKDEV